MVDIVITNKPKSVRTYTYNELVQHMSTNGLYTAKNRIFGDKPVLLFKIISGINAVPIIFTLRADGEFIKEVEKSLVFTDFKPIAIRRMEILECSE